MNILAIDPGNENSAIVQYATVGERVQMADYLPNQQVLDMLWQAGGAACAIEMIASYGMAVGREVFETCVWIGRFADAWDRTHDEPAAFVYRREVKMHLCGCNNAKDPNVRQSLIDKFGPGKDLAIGKKATPGPLYGIAGDEWSALAVAVTFAETRMKVPA